ncbi:MAG: hypothetical protein V1788_00280 [Nanoarchaeota archaeon]
MQFLASFLITVLLILIWELDFVQNVEARILKKLGSKLPSMPWHYANQNSFRCKECCFTSTIFPEVDNKKELDKIKKEITKNRIK